MSFPFNIKRDSSTAFITQVYDNTFSKLYSYDTKGYIQTIKDNSYNQTIISRYDNTNIKEIKENQNNYKYEYDNLNRLTKVTKNNQIIEEYQYDNQGNRISSTINQITKTGTYNSDDELISYGDNQYQYNSDGQLIQKTNNQNITKYSYDTFGNLKEVILPDQTKITYLYNANNQRTSKLINNQIHEKYLWLNLTTLLAVLDKDDNIKQRFIYADERTPISYTDNQNNIFYLSYNHIGTLKAVTDKNGNIVKQIEYDSFGNILNDTNPTLNIPIGFAGGLYDHDTKLTKFGYRDYDSQTGRWTTKDPIDFEGGSSNLYGYVLNDPVNLIDEDGLMSKKPSTPAQAGICTVLGVGKGLTKKEACENIVHEAANDYINHGDQRYNQICKVDIQNCIRACVASQVSKGVDEGCSIILSPMRP
jgi:RHS repeat-associated protein